MIVLCMGGKYGHVYTGASHLPQGHYCLWDIYYSLTFFADWYKTFVCANKSFTIVYLSSPEPSKNCHNLFTLHPLKER